MKSKSITHIILIPIIFLIVGALNCMADSHGYPIARIKTFSGKDVTLTNVVVIFDAERIHYYGGSGGQEVTFITYRHRTNLGPEFQGQSDSVNLYHGDKPAYFKKITFSQNGDPQTIEFQNHADISSKDVIFTWPGDPEYTSDQWKFSGKTIDGDTTQEVSIKGSKIATITFEGVPPQYSFDK